MGRGVVGSGCGGASRAGAEWYGGCQRVWEPAVPMGGGLPKGSWAWSLQRIQRSNGGVTMDPGEYSKRGLFELVSDFLSFDEVLNGGFVAVANLSSSSVSDLTQACRILLG